MGKARAMRGKIQMKSFCSGIRGRVSAVKRRSTHHARKPLTEAVPAA